MPVVKHEDQEFVLSHSEEEKLNEFQMITSFPAEELPDVVKLLKKSSWQLEGALGRYFDGNWKDNLDIRSDNSSNSGQSEIETGDVRFERGDGVEMVRPFVAGNSNLIPTLPIMSHLPLDYKERFQVVGLQNKKPYNGYVGNSFLFAIMLVPNVIVRLGTHILSWVGFFISYALGLNLATSDSPRAMVLPERPADGVESDDVRRCVETILGESAKDLLMLWPERSFNDIYRDCEDNFKFLLFISLGPLEGEMMDQNSYTFVKHVLGHPSTISLLQDYKDNIKLYIGSVQMPETLAVAKQLKLKYSLNCVLAAKVLNCTGSINGTQRMSVLGTAILKTPIRFQGSLKSLYKRYSPELIVSNTEKQQMEMARRIKQMQDRAYEESLNHDRLKKEKREKEAEEKELIKLENIKRQELERRKESLYHVHMLDKCLKLIEEHQPTPEDEVTNIQIRTADGKRIVKKFFATNTLREIYLEIAMHLYLNHHSNDKDSLIKAMVKKIDSLSSDDNLICFKNYNAKDGQVSLKGYNEAELKILIDNEKCKFNDDEDDYEMAFDFELISPFPRYSVPNDNNIELSSVSQLWPNGSLLVESLDENMTDDEITYKK